MSKKYKLLQSRSGYSLMELLLTIVVLSVVVSLAIPRYNMVLEKGRMQEAVDALRAIVGAERIYHFENHAFTSDLSLLDASEPSGGFKNFENLTATISGSDVIISLNSIDAGYTLSLSSVQGSTIQCSGGTGNICSKLGF